MDHAEIEITSPVGIQPRNQAEFSWRMSGNQSENLNGNIISQNFGGILSVSDSENVGKCSSKYHVHLRKEIVDQTLIFVDGECHVCREYAVQVRERKRAKMKSKRQAQKEKRQEKLTEATAIKACKDIELTKTQAQQPDGDPDCLTTNNPQDAESIFAEINEEEATKLAFLEKHLEYVAARKCKWKNNLKARKQEESLQNSTTSSQTEIQGPEMVFKIFEQKQDSYGEGLTEAGESLKLDSWGDILNEKASDVFSDDVHNCIALMTSEVTTIDNCPGDHVQGLNMTIARLVSLQKIEKKIHGLIKLLENEISKKIPVDYRDILKLKEVGNGESPSTNQVTFFEDEACITSTENYDPSEILECHIQKNFEQGKFNQAGEAAISLININRFQSVNTHL